VIATRVSAAVVFLMIICCLSSAEAVTVSTVAQIKAAVTAANGGGDNTIIVSAAGSPYNLNGEYFRLVADNITVSGSTSNRSDVLLDGGYVTTEIFQVIGSNVTIKNLTVARARYHPIHVFPESKDTLGTVIDNVHVRDPGEQAIKINQNSAKTYSANGGAIRNSKIELTSSGRAKVESYSNCYTGGVDAHHAAGWSISNNIITGFWCSNGLSEHGVHFWSFSSDTVVEKNLIINCDRGIGFGLGSSGHTGGIIRNNMIYHDTGHAYSDVGISLESASHAQVYNNTVFHDHSYPNAIEYRFPATSGGIMQNNLTNKMISSRDGGSANLSHNVTNVKSSSFVDATGADLHLTRRLPGIVDSGLMIVGLSEDFDSEARPSGSGIDIGADEYETVAVEGVKTPSWLLLLMK